MTETIPPSGTLVAKDAGTDGGFCPTSDVTVKCLGAIDCPTGQVCCAIQNGFAFDSECQAVADGGQCQAPPPATSNQGTAQLCETHAECIGGAECIPQTCYFGANLTICGVQTQYGCAANDAGLP